LNGIVTLVIRAPAGTSGTAKWTVVEKPPSKELAITR